MLVHSRRLSSCISVSSLIATSFFGGCTDPIPDAIAADDQLVKAIEQDLSTVEGSSVILETAHTDLGRPELGTRDEAIVLTRDETGYTLRYVFRFPHSGNANFRRWKLWMNHDIIEDGTGAEAPAIKTYSEKPSADEVATFKSDTLDHWSNRQ